MVESSRDPPTIALLHYEALNARDLDAYARLLAEDVEVAGSAGPLSGRQAVLAYAAGLLEDFPTMRFECRAVVARGEGCVVTELRVLNEPAEPVDGLAQEIEVEDGEITAIRSSYAPERAARAEAVDEQAALRRVAALAARGSDAEEVLDAVAIEASGLIGDGPAALLRYDADGFATIVAARESPAPVGLRVPSDDDSSIGEVWRTGRPSRTDTFDGTSLAPIARRLGVAAGVAVPIVVEGRTWGILTTSSPDRPIPLGVEERLAKFAELVGAAIAGAQARSELRGLADEQAALRRVAELVARGVGQEELFETVAVEASRLIDDEPMTLLRLDDGNAATIVASHHAPAPVGTHVVITPEDTGVVAEIRRTLKPARRDDYTAIPGPAWAHDDFGVGSSVGVPIVVADRLWGVLGAVTPGRKLPLAAEQRLQQFAELIAAALGNAQARSEVQQLADEQAALRRVAELVARGVPPAEVFAAVATEASRLLGDEPMTLTRFEGEHHVVVVAAHGGPAPVGARIEFAPDTLPDWVLQANRIARVDDYTRERDADLAAQFGLVAAVAAPITVEGRVWGMLTATSSERPLPRATEHRLQQFAELVGAAIANTEHRAQLTASRARVVATADETRRRLQRDLHDGAQQRLVQAVLTLKLARGELDDAGAGELVDDALEHVERANAALRDLVRGILPAALSRGGLQAGIESLVEDLPLPVELHLRVPRLPPAIETAAYFVVAEALTNVVKHSGATRAEVSAVIADERLLIDVEDDGCGGADARRGSGLVGLFDRVEAREGKLTITSLPGQGTRVSASLPLTLPS